MSTINPQPHQLPPGTRSQPAYEFPKRKRWADLLLSDLVDNVAFVLSPTFKILYCGSAVTEILGWRDMDLSDLDLIDLVPSSDQSRFRIALEEAIQGDCEFDIAVRLRTNLSAPQYTSTPAQEVLFEMKVYPHLGFENDSTESKCIFAMIPPYPSRNTALLNTMLDLKAENDRMSLQVTEYRSRLPAEIPASGNSPSSQSSSMYATSSLHSIRPAAMPMPISHNANDLPGTYTSPALISDSFDAMHPGVSEGHEYGKPSLYSSSTSIAEDQGDEGSKKKKAKKAHNAEQYVCITCGRTDSPEWRKGPLGPKTLCNACGLRWAKQMRKVDDPADGSAAVPTITTDS